MKLFIKNTLFFLLPFILLSYPLDLLISNKIKTTSISVGEYEEWNDIFDGNIDADIVIYGSSRAWVHFNTKIIEETLGVKAYNFGIDGHNFWLQYFRHKEYFKFNHHPKIIILSIDVFTLAKRKDLFNYTQFLPYMLWDKDTYDYTNSYVGFSKLDYFIPLLRYIGEVRVLRHLFDNNTPRYRYKGFKGFEREWNDNLKKAKKEKLNYSINIDTNSVVLLNKFIGETKEDDINLIFVYAPEYIEGQDFIKNRKQIISLYSELSKKYKIPFFNYSDSLISYKKELFYNSQHLNKRGADIFTRKFLTDFKKKECPNNCIKE